MNALAVEVQSDAFRETEKMLYAWGDESRERASELGLPITSGISRMIEQQRVFDQKKRDVRRRKPESTPTKLRDGTAAKLCACGRVYVEGECVIAEQSVCPRCHHDPRAPEAESHGTETRSFRPLTLRAVSSTTAIIEEIVRVAPNDTQKMLKRKYLFRQRDYKAAQELKVTKARYREMIECALEYVTDEIAKRLA